MPKCQSVLCADVGFILIKALKNSLRWKHAACPADWKSKKEETPVIIFIHKWLGFRNNLPRLLAITEQPNQSKNSINIVIKFSNGRLGSDKIGDPCLLNLKYWRLNVSREFVSNSLPRQKRCASSCQSCFCAIYEIRDAVAEKPLLVLVGTCRKFLCKLRTT